MPTPGANSGSCFDLYSGVHLGEYQPSATQALAAYFQEAQLSRRVWSTFIDFRRFLPPSSPLRVKQALPIYQGWRFLHMVTWTASPDSPPPDLLGSSVNFHKLHTTSVQRHARSGFQSLSFCHPAVSRARASWTPFSIRSRID